MTMDGLGEMASERMPMSGPRLGTSRETPPLSRPSVVPHFCLAIGFP